MGSEHVQFGDPATVLSTAMARIAAAGAGQERVTNGVAKAILDDLIARHGESHRRYHTVDHVIWVLRHVGDLVEASADVPGERVTTSEVDAIVAAALFHDAVYDPRSSTNEADSAALASTQLRRIGWDPDRCDVVAGLIVATAGHQASTPAAAILLDADLAVLGGTPAEYSAYVAGVRCEYEHVAEQDWRDGRASVLRSFIDRPSIYATSTMAAARELQARRNLAGELSALAGCPGAID